MCRPAAMVLVKGRKPYWSATKDSHIEIRREFGLPENGVGRVTSVQVEIVPPGGDFSLPLDKWEFAVDQDILPDWWDRDEAERDVRLELESWAKVRLIRAGDVRAEIKDGEVVTALLAGGTLEWMSGGTLGLMSGGTLGLMSGGTLGLMSGGTAIVLTHTTIRYQNSAVIVVRLPNERPATFVGDKDERVADVRKKERRQE